jgi:D-serine deaminase-like pyridoxal phosphate-dependent protein
MSQEVITVTTHATEAVFPFESFPLGMVVNLIPNHSCLAAACFDKYYIIDDPSCTFDVDQDIVDEWIPTKFFHLNC